MPQVRRRDELGACQRRDDVAAVDRRRGTLATCARRTDEPSARQHGAHDCLAIDGVSRHDRHGAVSSHPSLRLLSAASQDSVYRVAYNVRHAETHLLRCPSPTSPAAPRPSCLARRRAARGPDSGSSRAAPHRGRANRRTAAGEAGAERRRRRAGNRRDASGAGAAARRSGCAETGARHEGRRTRHARRPGGARRRRRGHAGRHRRDRLHAADAGAGAGAGESGVGFAPAHQGLRHHPVEHVLQQRRSQLARESQHRQPLRRHHGTAGIVQLDAPSEPHRPRRQRPGRRRREGERAADRRLLRRHARVQHRPGDGPAAPALRVRPHRRRKDGARSRSGSHDARAARPHVARRALVPRPVPLRQPVSARPAGARRAQARRRPHRDGRHRRADRRRLQRRLLSVRAAGRRGRALEDARRAGSPRIQVGRRRDAPVRDWLLGPLRAGACRRP